MLPCVGSCFYMEPARERGLLVNAGSDTLGAEAAAIAILYAVSGICRLVSRTSHLIVATLTVAVHFKGLAPTVTGPGPLFARDAANGAVGADFEYI